jgi:hypothetical protein
MKLKKFKLTLILLFIIILLISILLLIGRKIKLGEEILLIQQEVTSEATTIVLEETHTLLDGLEISIPKDAHSENTEYKISYAEIKSNGRFKDFNPLTPMIVIENGKVFTKELITLKIPISLPEGHFAMAFYYDKDSNSLEGIPLLSLTENEIVVATKHFSKIVISSIDEKKLMQLKADSGFRPGKDDWQFANRGSFIAPGGHCAGQSISAMWYYSEKTLKGEPRLYGRFDNNVNLVNSRSKTPNLWMDDSLGYRFASVLQKEINWASEEQKLFKNFSSINDKLTYLAFLYSIHLTGEPQFVGVRREGGGHAMIVYKAEKFKLYVADPNYYGQIREITFDPDIKKFKPYISGANLEEIKKGNGRQYPIIYYYAKTAIIPFDIVKQEWEAVENETIGNERFPEFKISYYDKKDDQEEGEWKDLKDGVKIPKQKDDVVIFTILRAYPLTRLSVFNGEKLITSVSKKSDQKKLKDIGIKLEKGKTNLGFFVEFGYLDDPKGYYVDFPRYSFTYGEGEEIIIEEEIETQTAVPVEIVGNWSGTHVFTDIHFSEVIRVDAANYWCPDELQPELNNRREMSLNIYPIVDGTGFYITPSIYGASLGEKGDIVMYMNDSSGNTIATVETLQDNRDILFETLWLGKDAKAIWKGTFSEDFKTLSGIYEGYYLTNLLVTSEWEIGLD